jgi:hypothetical protein
VITLIPVLRAGPSVSLDAPLNPDDVLTTPVEVVNNGSFDLNDVRVESLELSGFGGDSVSVGNIERGYVPPNKILKSYESETVPLKAFNIGKQRESEEIALIAFYNTNFPPFWHRRVAFRFKSVRQSDGRLRLEKQPAGDTLQRYDEIISGTTSGTTPPSR